MLAIAVPYALVLGLMPWGLAKIMPHVVPLLERETAVLLVYAFLGALVFGLFLATLAVGGIELQQAFTVLGHPGFKHFVRLRVSPGGKIDAWVVGKDDPLASAGPWLIDRWSWDGATARSARRNRQRDRERRPLTDHARGADGAAVAVEDALHDRQAEPGPSAARLRGEKRREDLRDVLGLDAVTRVGELDAREAGLPARDDDERAAPFRHRVASVGHEVHEDLGELLGLAEHRGARPRSGARR